MGIGKKLSREVKSKEGGKIKMKDQIAEVGAELSSTINTGNFENKKIAVNLKVTCKQTEKDITKAFAYVFKRLEKEITAKEKAINHG